MGQYRAPTSRSGKTRWQVRRCKFCVHESGSSGHQDVLRLIQFIRHDADRVKIGLKRTSDSPSFETAVGKDLWTATYK